MHKKVLVVDDSGFFRRRVSEILNADPGLEVVGTAENGEQAVEQVMALQPDVVTMDIEMPVMDGITAVRRIMARRPTPVLMFSSLTTEGAKATLEALDAGAMDFLPKRFEDISHDREEAKRLLRERVRALAQRPAPAVTRNRPPAPRAAPAPAPRPAPARPAAARRAGRFKLVAIGTSTGGPVALQEVLGALPADFPVPIVLVQHMPASFTEAFAARLDQLCAIQVRQARDGDALEPGVALLAPGGRQLEVVANGAGARVRVTDATPDQTYKPSVDITFASLARVFPDSTLAVVLTGMGSDGCRGAQALHQRGSTIWAQDEASSVVYGMPAAVAEAGVTQRILGLSEIGPALARQV